MCRGLTALQFPIREHWGLVLHRDHPLARKDSITPEDFIGLPLVMSQQELGHDKFSNLLGFDMDKLSIVITFNLAYNAFLIAQEQIGCVLCLEPPDRIRDPLCFRPLSSSPDALYTSAGRNIGVFASGEAVSGGISAGS